MDTQTEQSQAQAQRNKALQVYGGLTVSAAAITEYFRAMAAIKEAEGLTEEAIRDQEKFNAIGNLANIANEVRRLVATGMSVTDARLKTNYEERLQEFHRIQAKWFKYVSAEAIKILTGVDVAETTVATIE